MSLDERATQDLVDAYSSGTRRDWGHRAARDARFFGSRLDEREELENRLSKLSEPQVQTVHQADLAMIRHAADISSGGEYEKMRGDYYKNGVRPPKEHWWWWLDEIAQGKYPISVLPAYLRDEARKYVH